MFLVGLETDLESLDEELTPDVITDLVATLVDELHGFEPTVRTAGTGQEVKLVVEVVVSASTPVEAVKKGYARIDGALRAAGVTSDAMAFGDAVPSVRNLEPV